MLIDSELLKAILGKEIKIINNDGRYSAVALAFFDTTMQVIAELEQVKIKPDHPCVECAGTGKVDCPECDGCGEENQA